MKALHHTTPLHYSVPFSRSSGKQVFLKMECFQEPGSFKIRGIGRLCQEEVRRGKQILVSSSGGNAGLAVAYAGMKLGVETRVFVPESTPFSTRQILEAWGARVEVHGANWDDTHGYALEVAQSLGAAYVHPFDHPVIHEGHATLVDELVQQIAKPDLIILTVGGGGLLCGVVEGLSNQGWMDVPVLAVETLGADSFSQSVQARRLVRLPEIRSLASSLGARQVAAKALDYGLTRPVFPVVVEDRAALQGCVDLANAHRVLVEPACGAGLAALGASLPCITTARSVVLIVCGGIGADLARFDLFRSQTRDSG